MKKKVLGVILTVLVIFLLYIGLNIYQSNNIEIIDFEDMKGLQMSTADGAISEDTTISGTADVNQFESVAVNNRIVIEDTLYIIIYKWPTFFSDKAIEFNLENSGDLNKVNKISIVWGDIYTDEGDTSGFSYNDLINHPDQQIIWEKKGGNIE